MLEQLLRWIAAGDAALLAMSPIVATALAMLGAAAFTQTIKFALVEIVPDSWEDWSIRVFAISVTWLFLNALTSSLPWVVELILALLQPRAYTITVRVMRHYWPWLEATAAVGSARPSEGAIAALAKRRDELDNEPRP